MGDFLLLLPILEVARKYGSRVCLYTRSPYLALLDDDWDWLEKYDIDEKPDPFSDLPKSSLVVTSWRDLYWQEQAKILGASRTIFINPRPTDGAHFIQQAIDSLGWTLVSGWKKNLIWAIILGEGIKLFGFIQAVVENTKTCPFFILRKRHSNGWNPEKTAG